MRRMVDKDLQFKKREKNQLSRLRVCKREGTNGEMMEMGDESREGLVVVKLKENEYKRKPLDSDALLRLHSSRPYRANRFDNELSNGSKGAHVGEEPEGEVDGGLFSL